MCEKCEKDPNHAARKALMMKLAEHANRFHQKFSTTDVLEAYKSMPDGHYKDIFAVLAATVFDRSAVASSAGSALQKLLETLSNAKGALPLDPNDPRAPAPKLTVAEIDAEFNKLDFSKGGDDDAS